jgi:hypothetical protein
VRGQLGQLVPQHDVLTILESADHSLFKMVRYVLLRPLRPELDAKIKGGRRNSYGGVVTTPMRTVVRTPTRTMVRTSTANYV